jgi:hypothetical protein
MPPQRSTARPQPWFDVPGRAARDGLRPYRETWELYERYESVMQSVLPKRFWYADARPRYAVAASQRRAWLPVMLHSLFAGIRPLL